MSCVGAEFGCPNRKLPLRRGLRLLLVLSSSPPDCFVHIRKNAVPVPLHIAPGRAWGLRGMGCARGGGGGDSSAGVRQGVRRVSLLWLGVTSPKAEEGPGGSRTTRMREGGRRRGAPDPNPSPLTRDAFGRPPRPVGSWGRLSDRPRRAPPLLRRPPWRAHARRAAVLPPRGAPGGRAGLPLRSRASRPPRRLLLGALAHAPAAARPQRRRLDARGGRCGAPGAQRPIRGGPQAGDVALGRAPEKPKISPSTAAPERPPSVPLSLSHTRCAQADPIISHPIKKALIEFVRPDQRIRDIVDVSESAGLRLRDLLMLL